ncbi:MAG: nicotinamide-nucleotide amidohydrolase family protein [Chlamydiia bacterium]|nr:nicotinamide-nucleotide amidohydrolase family protein [Chlamydiia bacterium]
MSIEILSIGNELLSGQTQNTNVSTIGQFLLERGFKISRVTYLPDEREVLKEGIEEAMERSPFIITTGGLGPTLDDLTRGIVADIYHTKLVRFPEWAKVLTERYGREFKALEDQSTQPEGATLIHNPIGTAPGLIMKGTSTLFVLPGVPSQMEVMLPAVVDDLSSRIKEKKALNCLYLALLSEQDVDPTLRVLEKEHPEVEIGICPGYGTLSLYLQASDPSHFPPVKSKLLEKFPFHLFSESDKRIEVALHEWMVKNKKTLALGESCTGGKMAETLTAHPGASDYFLGSIVSYSNQLKRSALGVKESTLKTFGAVSQETVEEMAAGVLKLTNADYVITVSGIAGPDGGTPDKPVGTVWAAIKTPEKTFTGKVPSKPSVRLRNVLIRYSTTYLFVSLWRYLTYHIEPFS